MLKISFTNAEVSDHGYGLEVNGKSLEDIISTALGTKVREYIERELKGRLAMVL